MIDTKHTNQDLNKDLEFLGGGVANHVRVTITHTTMPYEQITTIVPVDFIIAVARQLQGKRCDCSDVHPDWCDVHRPGGDV